ncbi:MAG: hypothetical protein M3N24_00850 [Actinomycetota bacterium]|nr:hypothetical protein [Actinomycetota bacterium]
MEFDFWPAAAAGVFGGVMMEMATVVPRVSGLDVKLDLHLMWGRMMRLRNPAAGLAGTAFHLLISAAIGLVYAAGLSLLFDASNNLWAWGLLGGLIHWVVGGLFIGAALPLLHPDISKGQSPPGWLVTKFGRRDFLAFFVGHLLYGLTFGVLYPYFSSGGGSAIAF